MMFCLTILSILTWFATAAGTCLPNGVIPELRKNLTNAQGESFPVGVILQPYASARLAHEVLALITEVATTCGTRIFHHPST